MTASEATIQVTLRCSDRLDEYDTRTFTLRPGAAVQIGRASKNSAKPELMIGPENAFIDSPTISREHAVLTATSPPAPCVYITDKGSMHGTMVNGNKLEPQKAHRLSNGDVLQFGANVTRENRTFHHSSSALCQNGLYPAEPQSELHTGRRYPHISHYLQTSSRANARLVFYTSRSFTFESSLPSYPKGFSVPEDIESSDEEEVEVNEALSCSPRYGSQTNPVTIEDADEAQKSDLTDDDEFDDDELEEDLQDTTIPLEASEDTQERSPSSDVEEHVFFPEHLSALSARSQHLFGDDASSEDDLASGYSSEDDQASRIESCASLADSDESQSDGDMELEDNEDEENEVSPHVAPPQPSAFLSNTQMQLMLLEQQNRKRLLMARQEQDTMQNATPARESRAAASENQGHDTSSEMSMAVPSAPFAPSASSVPVTTKKDDAPMLFSSGEPSSKVEPPKLPEPEARMDQYFHPNPIFEEMCLCTMDPPRPAAPRPMQWGMLDYSSPFSPRKSSSLTQPRKGGFFGTVPILFKIYCVLTSPSDERTLILGRVFS
ncbi:hypothetical protein BU23DRAFT_220084 [Bimuria novae-zelandiae CBS 107.79]|uniref:FHA domain-containing protein n=1 Tax=Bimuria novae-zelandiae CBS 107.79 TaxID=1447943 RepID=A0A6A5UZ48_9PLEO|nr:hypothetical protein BU23DRAFT_220084 [Bimuria novae-zelandiae CBS 107.79]